MRLKLYPGNHVLHEEWGWMVVSFILDGEIFASYTSYSGAFMIKKVLKEHLSIQRRLSK